MFFSGYMLRSEIAESYDNSLFDLSVLIFKSFIPVTIILCLNTLYQCIPWTGLNLSWRGLVWVILDYFKSKWKDTKTVKVTEVSKVANLRGIELKLDWKYKGRINNQNYSHRKQTNDHWIFLTVHLRKTNASIFTNANMCYCQVSYIICILKHIQSEWFKFELNIKLTTHILKFCQSFLLSIFIC